MVQQLSIVLGHISRWKNFGLFRSIEDEVKKLVSHLKDADEDIFINVIKTEQLNGNFDLKPND